MGCRLFLIVSIAVLLSACEEDGCGGSTCPFAEPTHQAVVKGVVLDLNDQPLEGIYTSVRYTGETRSAWARRPTDWAVFTATARTDLGTQPDTASAWVRATQANPPPGVVVSDSVRVTTSFHTTNRSPSDRAGNNSSSRRSLTPREQKHIIGHSRAAAYQAL